MRDLEVGRIARAFLVAAALFAIACFAWLWFRWAIDASALISAFWHCQDEQQFRDCWCDWQNDGRGMTAILFVKGGDEYIRVATSVPKPDGSGRAIGTVLAGPALVPGADICSLSPQCAAQYGLPSV